MKYSEHQANFFQILLKVPANIQSKHHKSYYAILGGIVLAFLVHLTYVWVFWWYNVLSLFYYNIASTIFWACIILFLRTKGSMHIVAVLCAAEILLHQFLAIYILGWDYGFQYYFITVAVYPFLIYFESIVIPIIIAVISLISYFISYYYIQHLITHVTLPTIILESFFFTNAFSTFIIVGTFTYIYSSGALSFELDLEKEQKKSESLLLNILPHSVAQRLKVDQSIIADQFNSTSILFADIVNFTKMSEKLNPADLIRFLNTVFSAFDELVEKYQLEKIKTIGDAYMVAGGFPEPRQDHAEAIADLAIEMQRVIKNIYPEAGKVFDIRIGINTGPAVAGVIGNKKFIYDVWGDTVNTASRMESHGIPRKIQVSEQTYIRLRDNYILKERGMIEIKGKGKMITYLLEGKK